MNVPPTGTTVTSSFHQHKLLRHAAVSIQEMCPITDTHTHTHTLFASLSSHSLGLLGIISVILEDTF